MRLVERYKESPLCGICNYKAINIIEFNGQKMCLDCKKNIKRGLPIRKFTGTHEPEEK